MLCAHMKILIVDDDQTILAILRDNLVELGHAVSSARDGFEAIGTLTRDRPDVVILDYLMPRLSGLEVLKSIKQQEPSTFVILLTRMTAETVSRLPGVHRADAVLEKPVQRAQLERLLAKAARKRSSRPPA
jgi:CheY-like chemotaxis protein